MSCTPHRAAVMIRRGFAAGELAAVEVAADDAAEAAIDHDASAALYVGGRASPRSVNSDVSAAIRRAREAARP